MTSLRQKVQEIRNELPHWRKFLQRHRFTFTSFTAIGLGVFIFGIGGLYVQVHWLNINSQVAFLIQGFLSIRGQLFP